MVTLHAIRVMKTGIVFASSSAARTTSMIRHPAELPTEQLLEECTVEFLRRSGPGGQHRNKVETAVLLIHRPTGVRAEAAERRSQAENRTVALSRLRISLAIRVRLTRSAEQVPSALWQSRCCGQRLDVSPTHRDFPALLAELLDVLASNDYDPKPAAASLGCTPSQVVKFLKREPAALMLVNEQRRRQGDHRLQ